MGPGDNITIGVHDTVSVLYYIITGEKVASWLAGAGQLSKSRPQNHKSIANKYFNRDKIQNLYIYELQRLKDNRTRVRELIGLKELTDKKPVNFANLDTLDKETAINMLTKLINEHQDDPKVIKELIPRLTELKGWNKEKPMSESNISFFELPTKQ